MVTTVIWIVSCTVFSWLFRKRGLILLAFCILSYVAVPLAASGVTLLLRPGDYAVLVTFMLYAGQNIQQVGSQLKNNSLINSIIILVILYSIVASIFGNGSLGTTLVSIAKVVVLPYLAFLVVLSENIKNNLEDISKFSYILAFGLFLEIMLGIRQYQTGEPILWEATLASQWWWGNNYEVSQPIGTFGHWIPYSIFIALGLLVVLPYINRPAGLLLVMSGIYVTMLTAARSGILALFISIIAVLIGDIYRKRAGAKLYLIMSLPATILSFIIAYNGEIGTTLRDKLVDDGRSTELRLEATRWFWDNYQLFLLTGISGGTNLRGQGVLDSSLENAFYIHAITFGFLSSALIFLLFTGAALNKLTTGNRILVIAAYSIFVLSAFTSGGFSSGESSTLILFWILLALADVDQRNIEHKEEDQIKDLSSVNSSNLPVVMKNSRYNTPNSRISQNVSVEEILRKTSFRIKNSHDVKSSYNAKSSRYKHMNED